MTRMKHRHPPLEEIRRLDPEEVGLSQLRRRLPDGTREPIPRYQRFILAVFERLSPSGDKP